ncbi:hypothetical protein Acr_09g0000050 [Actinidia rufa]|uniref:Uncharacterized protein n=1 Tax=Actinidia rufa TaxID=165716 RepID=A0A7J0F5T5_9ERIC|nr:hypothetical protein Acr_09g0000050 [Actinidia rufa]
MPSSSTSPYPNPTRRLSTVPPQSPSLAIALYRLLCGVGVWWCGWGAQVDHGGGGEGVRGDGRTGGAGGEAVAVMADMGTAGDVRRGRGEISIWVYLLSAHLAGGHERG